MGIQGLLPLLKSIQKPCSLKKFQGLTLGVDAYGWLHRALVGCAMDIALDKPTNKFVDFAMHRVRMLVHFGVTPYLVFDGDYLPSKAGTEVERAKKRAESRKLGLDLYRIGKTSQAYLELQKAIDVTPEMARQLIDELKRHNIKYVVAPYEADSQLAYLEHKGIIQGVISEDSDLLVFGVKRLITKLDQYGECIEIHRRDFTALKSVSLVGWTDADFRRMAILSGCDYLPSINKMGLKTAYRLVRKHKTVEKILRMLSFNGQFQVPSGYLEDFKKAELTFLHQRVFCPVLQKLVMLTPFVGTEPEEFDFVGKDVDADTAKGVATGDLNPMTKAKIVLKNAQLVHTPSPWPLKRSKTISSPADLKPKKPIDDFFKPKRAPLAELDPNSLTPLSASQQRLLQQNDGTVYSTPVHPSPSTTGTHTAASEPNLARLIRGRVSSGSSVKQPSKRQRLCWDEIDAKTKGDAASEITQSRFFTSSAPEPSPSLNVKAKRSDKNFNLWSDDSLDEALGDLPEFATSNKMKVFCDVAVDSTTKQVQGNAVYESQCSTRVALPTTKQEHGHQAEGSQASTRATLSTENSDLSKVDTPVSSSSYVGTRTTTVKPKKQAIPALLELSKQYLTPSIVKSCDEASPKLSTLSNSLFNEPKISPSTFSSRPTSRVFCSPTQMVTISYPKLDSVKASDERHENILSTSHSTLLDEKSNLPSSHLPASNRNTPISGSEDCIVPCSDSEGEGDAQDASEDGQPKSLDLGRFLFHG